MIKFIILALFCPLISYAADSLVLRVDTLEQKVTKLEAAIAVSNGWSCQANCYSYTKDGSSTSKQVLSDGINAKQALENLWVECESFMHESNGIAWNIDNSSSTSGYYRGSIKANCTKN